MAVNADTLLDRLQLKSKLRFWRVITLLVVLGSAAVLLKSTSHSALSMPRDYVARVTVTGVIDDDLKMHEMLRDIAKDTDVKGVILRLDTPGGTAVGGEQLFLDVREIAKTKPVVAVMRNMAASAGYLTAIAADHVLAREGTITGSIGVILQTAEVTELAKKLGVTPITIKTGHHKATPSPFEKLEPDQRAALENSIQGFYLYFMQQVAQRRQIPLETVKTLADGRIFTGSEAVRAKLVDAIGGEEEAQSWLETNKKLKKGLPIVDIEPEYEEPGLLSELKQMASGKALSDMLLNHRGLSAIWKL